MNVRNKLISKTLNMPKVLITMIKEYVPELHKRQEIKELTQLLYAREVLLGTQRKVIYHQYSGTTDFYSYSFGKTSGFRHMSIRDCEVEESIMYNREIKIVFSRIKLNDIWESLDDECKEILRLSSNAFETMLIRAFNRIPQNVRKGTNIAEVVNSIIRAAIIGEADTLLNCDVGKFINKSKYVKLINDLHLP